jgi:preprotein translocase subunit SecE
LLLGNFHLACYNIRLMFAEVSKYFHISRYLSEVSEELKKVTWPTREQTVEKTILVIVVSVFVGAYIGLLDYLFTQAAAIILK